MRGERKVYFDTSALAKWYLNESQSEAVEAYLLAQGPVAISDLTVVEIRSLLARRRRAREIDLLLEAQVYATFQSDIRHGHLVLHPLPADWSACAVNLLSGLPGVALRSLDAIHLVTAQGIGASALATFRRGAGNCRGGDRHGRGQVLIPSRPPARARRHRGAGRATARQPT